LRKVVKVKGMTCAHCQKRVEDALNALPGLKAKVNLRKEEATVTAANGWDEEKVRQAISEVGYEVISIADKKGLFGR